MGRVGKAIITTSPGRVKSREREGKLKGWEVKGKGSRIGSKVGCFCGYIFCG